MEFEKCIFTYKVGDIFFEDTKDPINNFWQIIDCKETVIRTLKNDAVREQKKINLVIAHIGYQTVDSDATWGYRKIEPIQDGFTSVVRYDQQSNQVLSEKPTCKMTKKLVYERSTEDKPHFSNGNPILRRYTDDVRLFQDEEWYEQRYGKPTGKQ